ncbi:ABC transporter ATP-binding protein [Pelagibacterium montanilacus]|uniref:ABC transporter ATP-binding protein n=1 Tax=Pelagibacterium montanilacus TaxID=2185280 RepID=UPI000F8D1164|nr:ABC transporter ATP-binding protein [Pelagibacterium montanilacus]
MTEPVLKVDNLSIEFGPEGGALRVINDVSFSVGAGECLGIVGESGSGKSMTSLAIMRLIPSPPGRIATGRVELEGRNLLDLPMSQMPAIRGNDIAMIFQEPMSSLNPVMTIGDQISEAIMLHEPMNAQQRYKRTLEMLTLVGIPDPEKRFKSYPHEFSGGMRQRVMIAMALSCNPKVLIADEPTTALDVTIQAQVLELMRDLRTKFQTSIVLISHDLGVIADIADRVLVMYCGRVVEIANVDEIFADPAHPYTEGLLRSIPSETNEGQRLYQIPGTVPAVADRGTGCTFYDRCPKRMDICKNELPPHFKVSETHSAACFAIPEASR